MRFLGKEIVSGKSLDKIVNKSEALEKDYNFLMQNWVLNKQAGTLDGMNDGAQNPFMTMRPPIDMPMVSSDTGAKIPIFPFPLHFLYQLAKNVDALRIPVDVLNREIFRNGFEIVRRFKLKCNKCLKEFSSEPHNEKGKVECDDCESRDLSKPDPAQRRIPFNLLRKKQNNNGQTIKEISKQCERDLEIADGCYIALLKTYKFGVKKGIKQVAESELEEIIRLHPPQVFMIADYNGRLGYTDTGNAVYVCPRGEHRRERVYQNKDARGVETDTPLCSKCGCKTILAIAEVNSQYATNIPNPQRRIYAKGELIWIPGKYWQSMIYGYSNIYTIWQKVMALSHMDEYVRKYYDKMRPPKGLLVIGSRNTLSVQKSFDKIKVDAKNDPYSLHPLMVETDKGGRNMVQYIDLTGSLADLQFIEVRNEFRRTIGAMYGVLPFFSGDLPTGWNQEGMEAMVSNRAVSYGQQVLFEGLLEPLLFALGCTDWILRLKTGEETDDLRDEQIRAQKLTNARSMFDMGFEVKMDGEGEFEFSQEPIVDVRMQGQMNAQGGEQNVKNPKGSQENTPNFTGEHVQGRPSDPGGKFGGHPSSGPNTSVSKKSKSKPIYLTMKSVGGTINRNKLYNELTKTGDK